MRLFHLMRQEDQSGISGSGIVAEGAVFTDGTVAVKWLTKTSSLNIYQSVDDVIEIHGHLGRTVIVYREFGR